MCTQIQSLLAFISISLDYVRFSHKISFLFFACLAKHVDHNMFRNSRSLRAHWFYNHEKKVPSEFFKSLSHTKWISMNNFYLWSRNVYFLFLFQEFLFLSSIYAYVYAKGIVHINLLFCLRWFLCLNSIKIYVNRTLLEIVFQCSKRIELKLIHEIYVRGLVLGFISAAHVHDNSMSVVCARAMNSAFDNNNLSRSLCRWVAAALEA